MTVMIERLRLLSWTVGRGALSLAVLVLLAVAAVVGSVLAGGGSSPLTLIPVAGTMLLAGLALARVLAILRRVTAEKAFGAAIARPYLVSADRRRWVRLRATAADPASWRDLAWLALTVGLGLLPFVGLGLGLAAITMGTVGVLDPDPTGVLRAVDALSTAMGLPAGVDMLVFGLLLLTLWWFGTPALRAWDTRLTMSLLAPTERSRLVLRVRELSESRAETVDAQATELRRIERDLHDGAQARLVALGMSLGLAEEMVERDPAAARKLLVEARLNSGQALAELRDVVRGIHPPVLADRGLASAVHALALAMPLPVHVETDLDGRLPAPVESAGYFAVAEALANVVKHSGATRAWVRIDLDDGRLWMVVGDDGGGGADPAKGTGLSGIQRRLAAFDGTLTLSSPPGGPTLVRMELQCESSSAKTSPSSVTG